MRVVIAGTGIIGLTAGIALQSIGAEVLLLEQAPELRAAGASIGLWENALSVFDEFGVGEQVRAIGTPLEHGSTMRRVTDIAILHTARRRTRSCCSHDPC
jgi:2-polyprenyl-6-methoxyphenol hydroxylase-like FAD-dependent oxidoreductase